MQDVKVASRSEAHFSDVSDASDKPTPVGAQRITWFCSA